MEKSGHAAGSCGDADSTDRRSGFRSAKVSGWAVLLSESGKWVYQKEEDEDSSGWEKEDGGSYTVRGDHVAAALDDQTELTEDNVRGLEWFDEFYRAEKMETLVIRSGDWERMRS